MTLISSLSPEQAIAILIAGAILFAIVFIIVHMRYTQGYNRGWLVGNGEGYSQGLKDSLLSSVEKCVVIRPDVSSRLNKLIDIYETSLYWDDDDITDGMFETYVLAHQNETDMGWLYFGDVNLNKEFGEEYRKADYIVLIIDSFIANKNYKILKGQQDSIDEFMLDFQIKSLLE